MAELELKRIVEAVLFASDAPVSTERITEITGGSEGPLKAGRAEIKSALEELSAEYEEQDRAVVISKVAGGWQLYCRPEYAKYARDLHKGRIPPRLSQAALETLAIVAYKQPLVRAEIEGIRGVDSSGVLATLLKRNLVTIAGRAPGMGRALMYRTTKEFLRYFGLNTITDLPRLEEFAEVLGLQPGELAMTVEGAEHMAHVTAGAPDGEEAAEATGTATPVTAPEGVPSEETAGTPAASEEDPTASDAIAAEADVPTAEPTEAAEVVAEPSAETTVIDELEDAHALGDTALIQPLDEA